jgi:hypothetical protein
MIFITGYFIIVYFLFQFIHFKFIFFKKMEVMMEFKQLQLSLLFKPFRSV